MHSAVDGQNLAGNLTRLRQIENGFGNVLSGWNLPKRRECTQEVLGSVLEQGRIHNAGGHGVHPKARRQVPECQVEVASNLLEGVEVCAALSADERSLPACDPYDPPGVPGRADPAFQIPSADDPEVVGQSGTTIARVRTWRWVQLFLTRQRAVSPNRPRDIAAASVMPYTPNRAPRSFKYSRSKPH